MEAVDIRGRTSGGQHKWRKPGRRAEFLRRPRPQTFAGARGILGRAMEVGWLIWMCNIEERLMIYRDNWPERDAPYGLRGSWGDAPFSSFGWRVRPRGGRGDWAEVIRWAPVCNDVRRV